MDEGRQAGRIGGLDGLRGLAVLAVMLFHGQRLLGHGVVVPALDAGWVGVDVFFVLSGFLITGILLRTRGRPGYWRNFIVRRALRIFPLYFGLLALVLVPRALTGVPSSAPWWAYPTFLSNFWIPVQGGHDVSLDVTWSLAVEEQFYLLWPLVVALLPRRSLAVLCVVLLVVVPGARGLWFDGASEWNTMVTPFRLDSFAAGALAWMLRGQAVSRWGGLAALALLVPALGWLAWGGDLRGDPGFVTLGYSMVALGTAGLLLSLSDGHLPGTLRALEWRPLAHLGTVSYGAYLLHGVLCVALVSLSLPLWAGLALLVAVTWGAATLSWRTVEQPILRLKQTLAAHERA